VVVCHNVTVIADDDTAAGSALLGTDSWSKIEELFKKILHGVATRAGETIGETLRGTLCLAVYDSGHGCVGSLGEIDRVSHLSRSVKEACIIRWQFTICSVNETNLLFGQLSIGPNATYGSHGAHSYNQHELLYFHIYLLLLFL